MSPIIILIVVMYAALAFWRFDWALFVLLAALPTYLIRFTVFGLPTTLLEVMIVILFIYWLFIRIKDKELRIRDSRLLLTSYFLLLPLTLFLLSSLISIFVAPSWYHAFGLWRAYILEPFLFFIIFIDRAKQRPKFYILNSIFSLSVGALFISSIAIIQYWFPDGLNILGHHLWAIPHTNPPDWHALATRRVTSVFGFPNAVGLYLAPFIPLMIAMALDQRTFRSLLLTSYFLLLTLLSLAAIILAKSQGALLAVVIGLLFMAWRFGKGKQQMTIAIVVLLLAAVGYATRHTDYNAGVGQTSTQIRLEQWSETWQCLTASPKTFIFGGGLDGYKHLVAPCHKKSYIEIFQYPHNIILNFWSELGLLGIISFIWIVWQLLTIRSKHNLNVQIHPDATNNQTYSLHTTNYSLALTTSLLIILIHGLVDVPYFKNDLAVMFWVIAALIILTKTGAHASITPSDSLLP